MSDTPTQFPPVAHTDINATTAAAFDHDAALEAAAQVLRARLHTLDERHRLPPDDVARLLGVTEGELVAAQVGHAAIRLQAGFIEMMEQVPAFGTVLALTRNGTAEHCRIGRYEKMSHKDDVGLVLGTDIDLRIFYAHWSAGYALAETPAPVARGTWPQVGKSLQFFDANGTAIHQIFLLENSDHAAFDAWVARWRAADQRPGISIAAAPEIEPETPDAQIDVAGFRAGWQALTDVHQFFALLRRFGVTRAQGLRLAEPGMVRAASVDHLHAVLEHAAREQVPIMVFVGSVGVVQIHRGPLQSVAVNGSMLKIDAPNFHLKVRDDLIAHLCLVRKPTSDGFITSLEVFDAEARNVMMIFGARRPGEAELHTWRDLVQRIVPSRSGALQPVDA